VVGGGFILIGEEMARQRQTDADENGDAEVDGHLEVEVKAVLDVAATVVGKRASSDARMDGETEADGVNAAAEGDNGTEGGNDDSGFLGLPWPCSDLEMGCVPICTQSRPCHEISKDPAPVLGARAASVPHTKRGASCGVRVDGDHIPPHPTATVL
jgi:hypothetical protein